MSESADEAVYKLRCALADYLCRPEVGAGLAPELRVVAMIQFAAAGLVSLDGNPAANVKYGFDVFVKTMQQLMPQVHIDFGYLDEMPRPPSVEVH